MGLAPEVANRYGNLDAQIQQLTECKPLSEAEVVSLFYAYSEDMRHFSFRVRLAFGR